VGPRETANDRWLPTRMITVAGGGLMVFGSLGTVGAGDDPLGSIEIQWGRWIAILVGVWIVISASRARFQVNQVIVAALLGGAITGLQVAVVLYEWRIERNYARLTAVAVALMGASLAGLGGLIALALDASSPAGRRDPLPTIVRLMGVVGGLAMTIGPFLRWRVLWDLGGNPHWERGVGSNLGATPCWNGVSLRPVSSPSRW
jgi:hypothetical protein